jgi:hypothetical protein
MNKHTHELRKNLDELVQELPFGAKLNSSFRIQRCLNEIDAMLNTRDEIIALLEEYARTYGAETRLHAKSEKLLGRIMPSRGNDNG